MLKAFYLVVRSFFVDKTGNLEGCFYSNMEFNKYKSNLWKLLFYSVHLIEQMLLFILC